MKKGDTVQIKESKKVGDICEVDGRYYLVNVNGCTCGYYTSSDLTLIAPKPSTGGKLEFSEFADILTIIDQRLSKLEKLMEEK